MIDAHCHIDLYKAPEKIAVECEKAGIYTIGMTNLPSHFEIGFPHLRQFSKVRLALGMHPLLATSHKKEFPGFIRNLSKTSYIGEVGLDFSKEGIHTKAQQIESFERILKLIGDGSKIISIHSRRAEKDVLQLLIANKIRFAIFHWYSGPINLISEIVNAGYYFSVNPAMTKSANGQSVINKIPLERLLTESDGPFIEIENRSIHPKDVQKVLEFISQTRNMPVIDIEKLIDNNFQNLIRNIRSNQ